MVTDTPVHTQTAPAQPEATAWETPLKWCAVALSDVIFRGKRLEASVFDVDAKQARNRIRNGKYELVPVCGERGLASAYTCGRFKRVWVNRSDLPIYQPSAIVDIKPAPDGYLSRRTRTDIDALRVRKGQVLMTCSGTIGKAAYVSETLNGLIFSHDLLRITGKEPYDAGFLYAYLKSATGNKILMTNSYGAVVTHIEAEHLEAVPVPNAPRPLKKRISDLVERSYALRDASNALIDEASALLIDALALPPIQAFQGDDTTVQSFSVKLSKMNLRLDASYHAPIADAIVHHLNGHAAEVATVGDRRISKAVVLPGRFARVYVAEGQGKVLFGGKQLYELDPSGKKYLSLSKHGARIARELEIEENMTLITRSGTIGKVALVPKHWERWVASEHIIRVVPASDEVAGYLNIFLASDYGRALITRYTFGSVVDEIDEYQVRETPIPILEDPSIQRRINRLALEANLKRYEAYRLEQEALRIMDEEVIFAR